MQWSSSSSHHRNHQIHCMRCAHTHMFQTLKNLCLSVAVCHCCFYYYYYCSLVGSAIKNACFTILQSKRKIYSQWLCWLCHLMICWHSRHTYIFLLLRSKRNKIHNIDVKNQHNIIMMIVAVIVLKSGKRESTKNKNNFCRMTFYAILGIDLWMN